ncbi:MAG: PfaD family polyunsaturated fatty acid/polyketide biosynthesis protein [Anaerolineales bacterium]
MNEPVAERVYQQRWQGPPSSIAYEAAEIRERLGDLAHPCFVVKDGRGVGVTNEGHLEPRRAEGLEALAVARPLPPQRLGDPAFRETYGTGYAYMAGAMANAISGEELVIALGSAGLLGSFGAGGLTPARLETALRRVQRALPEGPYAFNLIHSPGEPALERRVVDLYLEQGVRTVEASAYLRLTPEVVRYRVAGLSLDAEGKIVIGNRIIAKLSRREVAVQFLQPAPAALLRELVEQGRVTEQQARLAGQVPVADDITVEADSGGHTDNRPLVCLLPSLIALRNEIQAAEGYATPVRIGAAGGIGTPVAVLGAFMMGAAYVVTGSINHGCVEAGTSQSVKTLLAQAATTDVMMAPAADMFEMGVQVQVLKRGTLFPMRARKLFELYQTYDSIEALPAAERTKIEKQIFRRSCAEVWQECITFFSERDPEQIRRAEGNPKRKMALIFRWYLGLATPWAVQGEEARKMDYQIWCGPAMGAFNDWARGTNLEEPQNRHAVDIAHRLLEGAARLYRLQELRLQGLRVPREWDVD